MIPLFRVFMADDAAKLVGETLQSGYIGEGPQVAKFEQEFAKLVGFNTLAVNSGTSALELALYLCGVGLGTDVVTTPMTCTATNGAILRLGGTPIWADIDPLTGLIDPADVARKVTKRTKAIMAVDWAGRSCDYETLNEIGYPVIQDAAHNLFVDPDNCGDYICWSFQAIKHLTTGDGGALHVPKHQQVRGRLLRWYGLDRTSSADFRCSQNIVEAGWKAHMNDVSASIGLANLPHASSVVERHRANAAWYDEAFRGIDAKVILPEPDEKGSWWLYTLLVNDRDSFTEHMTRNGVAVSPVHRRNDEHSAFYYPNGRLPGVDWFAEREVAIPVGWWLTDSDRQQIADAVWSFTAGRKSVAA